MKNILFYIHFIYKMKFSKVLTNKYTLYIILFLAITNVLGYLMIGDFDSLGLFIAIGFLTAYFSKNMVVVLGTAMVATNFIFTTSMYREGLMGWNNKELSFGSFKKFREGLKNKKKKKKKKESMAPIEPEQVDEPEPADESEEDEVDKSPGQRVDYASTMEMAYNNLESVLGKGGIGNLTKETQNLLNQQKQLAGQLESMAPLLSNAKGLLNNMNLPNMKEIEGLLTKLAPAMTSKK
jgi:hypothetical protein